MMMLKKIANRKDLQIKKIKRKSNLETVVNYNLNCQQNFQHKFFQFRLTLTARTQC